LSEIELLYRDRHLVAVNKPAGLLVHRSDIDRHEQRFALQLVRDAIGRRVWPVHRLDKGTSGVLVFALSPETASALGSAFEAGGIDKRYVALVRGWPSPQGHIEHPLARRLDDAELQPGSPNRLEPQPATTDYLRLGTVEIDHAVDRFPSARYALIALSPRTGRRHQLRRHLKHIGHPILGDATYGKGRHNRFVADLVGAHRLWLHAASVAFRHPHTGKPMTIEAPLGSEWLGLIALGGWRWDSPWQLGDEPGALIVPARSAPAAS
jgi:tRNA pseudouridine65 synthase